MHRARGLCLRRRGAAALLAVGALAIVVRPLAAQEHAASGTVAGTVASERTPLAEGDASDRPATPGTVATGDFLRMVLVLAAVLGAIYLLLRLIRRGAAGRLGSSDRIDLLASRSLGGNRSLHLVRVGREFLLVGAADQAVNLVARITDPESIDTLQASATGGAGASRSRFAELLADVGITESRRRAAAPEGDGDDGNGARLLRRQRHRLRREAAPGEGVRAAR